MIVNVSNENCFTNGYLDTMIDCIPGLERFRLKDLPGYIRTTYINSGELDYVIESVKATRKVSNIILHTFEELESTIIEALQPMIPHIYTIGPLELLLNPIKLEEETNKLDIMLVLIGFSQGFSQTINGKWKMCILKLLQG
ncbi:hypothetical protein L2E82_29877 [Cichorium intybus]|uniref:Uncharacterized protein n=1 Tax=Cichorium intybus TaxID=13427 RepID=A0ACB9CYU6_CICIN|nr:hypothetical protein L2E82_29877 [Cichorium intybus]